MLSIMSITHFWLYTILICHYQQHACSASAGILGQFSGYSPCRLFPVSFIVIAHAVHEISWLQICLDKHGTDSWKTKCICRQCWMTKLVSWSITSHFSTNMAISETKGQGWRAIPTQWRKASDILTSILADFLFSSHPKGKGIERLI